MGPKPITRRAVLSLRDALNASERAAASTAIADAAMRLVATLPPGSLIALYAPKGTEVDTTRIDVLARARGHRIAYPRIADGERELAFHEVAIDALVPSKFGLREPTRSAPIVELAEIAALVIPGLAFDRAGGRIGWGRGYYDVTLAAIPSALRIGLAFECQLVERVPREAHDASLHYVVTESAMYRALD